MDTVTDQLIVENKDGVARITTGIVPRGAPATPRGTIPCKTTEIRWSVPSSDV